jgi:hypothetical protein
MSDALGNFLVDVALNPDRLERASADLPAELARTSLEPHEQEALLTRDSRRVGELLGASRKHQGLGITIKPKRPKKPQKAKRPAPKKRPTKSPRRKKTKR